MCIYKKPTIPFVYLLRWTKHGKWYYGSKYSIGCHPSDLWTKYFTSSTYVKEFRELYGEPDVIEIRRTFKTQEEAVEWESKFLKRILAYKHPQSLNYANPGAYGTKIFKPKNLPGNSGPKVKLDLLEKQTIALLNLTLPDDKVKSRNKGRYWVNYKHMAYLYFVDKEEREDFLKNNPNWEFGRTNTKQREKLSKSHTGKPKPPRSDEHRRNIGLKNKGLKKPGSGPKGMIVYHNFEKEIRLNPNIMPPAGFIKGRVPKKYKKNNKSI